MLCTSLSSDSHAVADARARAAAGARSRMKRRFAGKRPEDAEEGEAELSRASALVKTVMETSGGDNEALARKIRSRFDTYASPGLPTACACARPLNEIDDRMYEILRASGAECTHAQKVRQDNEHMKRLLRVRAARAWSCRRWRCALTT